jgi:hypothetical protein
MTKDNNYGLLKNELDNVERILSDSKCMSYERYSYWMDKKRMLLEMISELPLIYEIWLSGYDGSMSMYHDTDTLEERYINMDKAYLRLDELNDACNYGRPYYIKVSMLDG